MADLAGDPAALAEGLRMACLAGGLAHQHQLPADGQAVDWCRDGGLVLENKGKMECSDLKNMSYLVSC